MTRAFLQNAIKRHDPINVDSKPMKDRYAAIVIMDLDCERFWLLRFRWLLLLAGAGPEAKHSAGFEIVTLADDVFSCELFVDNCLTTHTESQPEMFQQQIHDRICNKSSAQDNTASRGVSRLKLLG